ASPPHCGFSTVALHRKTLTADERRSSRFADREFRSPRHNDGRPVQETTAAADASPEFPWPHFPPKPYHSCSRRNRTSCGLHTLNPDPTQVTIEPLLWLEARAGHGVSGHLLAAKAGGC